MSYSIRDLEHLSGIKAHTLRIWEQRYNILNPKRTDTNIRLYDDSDLKLILNISLLNDNGFKISKIAEMSAEDLQAEVLAITERTYKYPEQIQALTLAMIDLDEARFERLMSANIMHFGFERTMSNIVFPFMLRIGFLWQTGAINPAQEHFITFLIRQKLMVAMDGLPIRYTDESRRFMLFLPEGELHELSLLFANYLIRARNHRSIYLGQSLPLQDVVFAHKIYQPDYLVCILTTVPGMAEIQRYINHLSAQFPETTILLSGYQVVGQDLELNKNQKIFPTIDSLVEFLDVDVYANA